MDFIEIKDLSLAAYIFSIKEIKLKGKRRLPNGDILFQFSPRDYVEDMIRRYWNMEAPAIQPKQLFNAQRDLKDMIFSS